MADSTNPINPTTVTCISGYGKQGTNKCVICNTAISGTAPN